MGASNSIDQEKPFRDLLPTTGIKETLLAGGTWSVRRTTLPLWLEGDKLSPTLTYTQDPDSPGRMHDLVQYKVAGGKEDSIAGGDTWPEEAECPAHLLWRGEGILSLITSDWYVIHISESKCPTTNTPMFVFIYFKKTMFTPLGMDVLTPSSCDDVTEEALVAEIAVVRSKFTMLADVCDALAPIPKNLAGASQ